MKQNHSTAQQAKEPKGRYADLFYVGYNSSVFVFDFEQSFCRDEKEHIHTRIITSPENAKAFFELLQKTVGQYEERHGVISLPVNE
ncbi:DUF3467 domain-containing protein [uncultured Desulfobacter sp.]|uniref:DUF3467 domain-containing protein n=1 Tax=uncultured Desulfobacter sp. TaxID=240139 RepID=UPI0029F50C11|nr:DUF3467 domain-containing protein [uncultured Desulfobacter sp.]